MASACVDHGQLLGPTRPARQVALIA